MRAYAGAEHGGSWPPAGPCQSPAASSPRFLQLYSELITFNRPDVRLVVWGARAGQGGSFPWRLRLPPPCICNGSCWYPMLTFLRYALQSTCADSVNLASSFLLAGAGHWQSGR